MKQATARQANFRICPECGTRNRPKWDFCAKCGESLQDVPLGEPAPVETAAEPLVDEAGVPWASTLGVAILIGATVATYWYFREPPASPSSEIFTLATLPPSLPPAGPPTAKQPGQDAYDRGRRLLDQGDPAGAARLFADAVSEAPDNHAYHHAHGVALWQSGARSESIDEYNEALRLSPDNPTYRLNLAKALVSVGRTSEAIREFEAVAARTPNAEALEEAARLYAKGGDYARAADEFRRIAAMRPNDAVVQQELASALEKSGQVDQAAQLYGQILQANPNADITRGLLAEIYFNRGQKDEAIALFRERLAQDAQAPLLHRGLGSLLERTGQIADAVNEYREYARRAPNAADAKQLAERADRLERRLAAAGAPPSS